MPLKKQIKELEKMVGIYNNQLYRGAILQVANQISPPRPPEAISVDGTEYLSRAEFDAFFDYCVKALCGGK